MDEKSICRCQHLRAITFDITFVNNPKYLDQRLEYPNGIMDIVATKSSIRGFMSLLLRIYGSLLAKKFVLSNPLYSMISIEYPFLLFYYFLNQKVIYSKIGGLYFTFIFNTFTEWLGSNNTKYIDPAKVFDCLIKYLIENQEKYPGAGVQNNILVSGTECFINNIALIKNRDL